MIPCEFFRQLALSYPEVIELPHFEKTSFRINKKIFATMDEKANLAMVKLSELDQNVFSAFDNTVIYPVPNKWGKQGATYIDLTKVREDILKDIVRTSYVTVAPKK